MKLKKPLNHLLSFLTKHGIDFSKMLLAMLEQADIAAIFALKGWDEAKLQEFKTILFTIPAGVTSVQAVLAWLETQNGETKTIVSALFETAFAAAIDTAVVGSLLDEETFKVIAPAIFTAALGAKGVFKSLSSAYTAGQASVVENKHSLIKQAIKEAIIAVSALLVSAGVETSMIEEMNPLAILGLIGASMGLILAGCELLAKLHSLYSAAAPGEAEIPLLTVIEEELALPTAEDINGLARDIENLPSPSTPSLSSSTMRYFSRLGLPTRKVCVSPTTDQSQQEVAGTAQNEHAITTMNQEDKAYNRDEDSPRSHRTCGVQ